MKKKIINVFLMALLAMVTVGTVVSCKDYEEDNYSDLNGKITVGLQEQVDALEKVRDDLQGQLTDLKNQLGNADGTDEGTIYARIVYLEQTIEKIENLIENYECVNTERVDQMWKLLYEGYGTSNAIAELLTRVSTNEDDIKILKGLLEGYDPEGWNGAISDAIYADTDTPHPRMYGAFPKAIREYVVERKMLSLEQTVNKMTALPASRMKLKDRGLLQEGYFADVNVFDLNEFRDNATFAKPTLPATGLYKCIMNGQVVLSEGQVIKMDAGKVVKVIR